MNSMVEQHGVFTELANAGVVHAAAILKQMTKSRVSLCIPSIKILSVAELKNGLKDLETDLLTGVRIGFKEQPFGFAELLFPKDGALKLVSALTDEDTMLSGLDSVIAGMLTEVGNIVLSGVLGSVASQFDDRFICGTTHYTQGSVDRLIGSYENDRVLEGILARVDLSIGTKVVEGRIVVLFEPRLPTQYDEQIKGNTSHVELPPLNEARGTERACHLLDRLAVGVCLLSRDFVVLFWNSCLEEWTGIPRDTVVGTNICDRFPHLADSVFTDRLKMVLSSGLPAVFSSQFHKYIFPALLSNQRLRTQRATATAVPTLNGKCNEILLVVEDVTNLTFRVQDYKNLWDQAGREAARRKNAEQELLEAHDKLEERVRQRTAELVEEHRRTELLLSSISATLITLDRNNRVTQWNESAAEVFGIEASDVVGRPFETCNIEWDWEYVLENVAACWKENRQVRLEDVHLVRADGVDRVVGMTANPVMDGKERMSRVLLLGADVTERASLKAQLEQAQKLEAMGQLAAGIAHEINTPTQYVGDNTRFLQESCSDIFELLSIYRKAIGQARKGKVSDELLAEVQEKEEHADLDYLAEEIPQAIKQSLDGVDRVTKIVRSMKEFSHPNSEEKTAVDLNKAIESTLTVCRNEWKYVAELEKDFDSDLPPVHCLLGDLNQMILNMVINAAHAIENVVGCDHATKGKISVSTRRDGEYVEIRISDTGCGIPEDVRSKVFDLFFTTKPVGKGTGQGLAIARAVAVEKHGGMIDVQSEVGKGTTFIIRMPLQCESETPVPMTQELANAL